MASMDAQAALADTRRWLDLAVVGLNLCPFAKSVLTRDQVRFVCSGATTPEALARELAAELQRLADTDPEVLDTTLIVHPQVLRDFDDFNDFLDVADALLEDLGLDGDLQVASFHPDYRFADAEPDDVANASNRSPHPTLHLLREASIERAVAAFPEAEAIWGRNVETLRRLGWEGWRALWAAAR